MKPNLGELLRDLQVLDEAAGLAPLNRPSHVAVQTAAANLRAALPELWDKAEGRRQNEETCRAACSTPMPPPGDRHL